jgi:hypothetical protein
MLNPVEPHSSTLTNIRHDRNPAGQYRGIGPDSHSYQETAHGERNRPAVRKGGILSTGRLCMEDLEYRPI